MSILTTLGLISPSEVPNVPTGTANDVLYAALNISYFVAGLIAVLIIILAGFTLVTNGSEPETLKKARNSILYAVIGIVIILSAFTVTWFLMGRVK